MLAPLLLFGYWLIVVLTHFDLATGIYNYDPRSEEPSRLFLVNRPDHVLLDVLTKQLQRDGTYPPESRSQVINVQPLRVDVSTYTDWQAYAYITTRLNYADGTWRIIEFRFHSLGSGGIPLPIINDVTIRAYFARVRECRPESEHKSVCGLY
ncbi:MAG: hypothetical protein LC737_09310 [Chloroflexi bacterium]|nr:hypothetical protein [Chloroflexota bacterium]